MSQFKKDGMVTLHVNQDFKKPKQDGNRER